MNWLTTTYGYLDTAAGFAWAAAILLFFWKLLTGRFSFIRRKDQSKPPSKSPNPAYFDDPDYVADLILLGKVYSTSTIVKPWVPTELLLDGFRQVGGSQTQFEVALRYALATNWLVLDEAGLAVKFGQAGFDLYS